jgi:uncharacterized protein
MDSLSTLFLNKSIPYRGPELRPHWIYENTGILGNALVSFQGICDVPLDHMVDLEDVKKKAPIYSPEMVHFLGEFFIDSLTEGILLQHLLVATLYEWLWENGVTQLSRRGNDIYYQGRKFSVSIATKSAVSVLIHLGVNVKTEGTPIPTSGLEELKIAPDKLVNACLQVFSRDYHIWKTARFKVSSR